MPYNEVMHGVPEQIKVGKNFTGTTVDASFVTGTNIPV